MRKMTQITFLGMLAGLALSLMGSTALAFVPEVIGNPPAPAGNLDPPAPFIGMLIAFFCFFLVVGVSLIPSKRSDAND